MAMRHLRHPRWWHALFVTVLQPSFTPVNTQGPTRSLQARLASLLYVKGAQIGITSRGANVTIGGWHVALTLTLSTDGRYDTGQNRQRAHQREEEELGASLAGRR